MLALVLVWGALGVGWTESASESSSPAAGGELPVIRIGLDAKQGKETALREWTPTAEYLSEQIPGYRFVITPLDPEEMNRAAQADQLEFFLINPQMYVELDVHYAIRRLATLKNLRLGKGYTELGSVIFKRSDRVDIQGMADLKGKTLAAVDAKAFGGWLVAWDQLVELGFDPVQEMKEIRYLGTHDKVVEAIRSGEADVGVVRTDILEGLARQGRVRLEEFALVVRNDSYGALFPFWLSSRLYPEWTLAAARNTPPTLVEKTALALFGLNRDHPAARAARYDGWTPPANYQPVHELLRRLRVAPYEHYGKATWRETLATYWPVIVLGGLLVVVSVGASVYFLRLNRRLTITQEELRVELAERRRAERELEDRNLKLREAQRRVREELTAAHSMQQSILPESFPRMAVFSGFAVMRTAQEMGGDFYDYFPLDAHRVGVVIADVSGHGVPAAFFMAISRTVLRNLGQRGLSPAACLGEANRVLCAQNPLELFITMFYGVLDTRTSSLIYSNGGHNHPYILASDGTVQPLEGTGDTALGVMSDLTYGETEIAIYPGEGLFFFTDGVTEARNPEGALFGTVGLEACLNEHRAMEPEALVEAVMHALHQFAGNVPLADDVTCMALSRRSGSAAPG
ncbi:MAG: SpoIIE family protein phosphatase [Magnetococcales bacterium]|nr:SpoIIE family protein phosphatase [Magnetococcales bacterium]